MTYDELIELEAHVLAKKVFATKGLSETVRSAILDIACTMDIEIAAPRNVDPDLPELGWEPNSRSICANTGRSISPEISYVDPMQYVLLLCNVANCDYGEPVDDMALNMINQLKEDKGW